MRIPEEEVDAVRQKADIVQVVSKYLKVQRSGNDYRALCPFHDDHSPSMHISPSRQIFKCFVCGAGGNVFTFVQRYENVSFPEAVQEVASIVGVPLSVHGDEQRQIDPHKETLYKILKETIRYSMFQINTPEAKAEKEYLDGRGLDSEVRKTFEIGYNPPGSHLYEFLKAKGYKEEDMAACNVVRPGSFGMSDVFAGRITFPIHDAYGNPIGFSARTIDKNNPSKYINTNDTELFHKSDLVYNAHRAKAAARKQGKLYICEGVTDVIAMARAGVENAVCTLGTSCTDHQIGLMKNLCPTLVFCYDGDDAGQAATWRAAHMALAAGADVHVIRNTTKLDPDEIIRQRGAEALQDLLKQEIVWPEFMLAYLSRSVNFANYLEKKEYAAKAQKEIAALSDPVDREHFAKVLEDQTGFTIQVNADKDASNRSLPERHEAYASARTPDGTVQAEEQILAMMLASRQAAQHYTEAGGFLMDPLHSEVANLIVDAYRSWNEVTPARLIDAARLQEQKDLISGLAESWVYQEPYDPKKMEGALRQIKAASQKKTTERLRRQLNQPMDAETAAEVMKKYQDSLKALRRYYDEENSDGSL